MPRPKAHPIPRWFYLILCTVFAVASCVCAILGREYKIILGASAVALLFATGAEPHSVFRYFTKSLPNDPQEQRKGVTSNF